MVEEGQADYDKGRAISVVVYNRSMKMDGPCAVNRCMTDGKLENVEFFLFFGPSRTFTCWGYVQFFDTCNVYYHLSINITRIKLTLLLLSLAELSSSLFLY